MDNTDFFKEFSQYILDPREDYRELIEGYKLSKRGDLLIRRDNYWETLIYREQLSDGDWICDMLEKSNINYGKFVKAYLHACVEAGIEQVTVRIFGICGTYILEGERKKRHSKHV